MYYITTTRGRRGSGRREYKDSLQWNVIIKPHKTYKMRTLQLGAGSLATLYVCWKLFLSLPPISFLELTLPSCTLAGFYLVGGGGGGGGKCFSFPPKRFCKWLNSPMHRHFFSRGQVYDTTKTQKCIFIWNGSITSLRALFAKSSHSEWAPPIHI